MNISEFIKKELSGWGKYERYIFPLGILFIVVLSVLNHDSIFALISAVCGISYTIIAGKGKISCYIFGLAGIFCYSYISYKSAFWGNLLLYILYYLPMQIIGVFSWKKKLRNDTFEIIKEKLTAKQRILYLVCAIIIALIFSCVLKFYHDTSPYLDSITTIFSIFAMFFVIKRLIEQWYCWFLINILSLIMWLKEYLHGVNCLATVLMWITYTILAVYFLHAWKKDMNNNGKAENETV